MITLGISYVGQGRQGFYLNRYTPTSGKKKKAGNVISPTRHVKIKAQSSPTDERGRDTETRT